MTGLSSCAAATAGVGDGYSLNSVDGERAGLLDRSLTMAPEEVFGSVISLR
jgi:hypothetical protein